MSASTALRCFILASFGVLAACAQHVAMVDEESNAPLPVASYQAELEAGARVYRLLPQQSHTLIRVTREGVMRRLGHDHAVASENVEGYVALHTDSSATRADIAFPVRNLSVDKAEHRDQLGLDTTPTETDIAGTYTNMLKVLQPDVHAWVTARASIASGDAVTPTLSVSITMNGNTIEHLIPVELQVEAAQLIVSGHTTIKQSNFGLEPFQAAGGLLRVADELDIEFRFVAQSLQ